jgi:hypothetical protein
VANYPAAAAAAAVAAVDASAARETLENTTAAEGVSAGEQQWSTDYAAVAQAESAAQTASVFRRSAAQKDAEEARSRFQATHKAAPAPTAPAVQKAVWARAATRPGASARLDAARAAEQAAIARRARLLGNPAPSAGAPTAPRPGTPQQEAGKDAAFKARTASWNNQQDASSERGASSTRTNQTQVVPSKSPTAEL